MSSAQQLTVCSLGGDGIHHALAAGMIELFLDSNRLCFNIDNAGKSGLRGSSNLLQSAASGERNR